MDAIDLDTPALYVDLDVMEHNIAQMQEQCRAWGVELRPHVKTHKIPEIAQMQLDAGAIGITVAKLGEAEVLPGEDVLVAYPLMKEKVPRLRELAKTRRVKVAVDSVEVARGLQGIATLVEIDVGVGRTGAQSPEQAVQVARRARIFRESSIGRRGSTRQASRRRPSKSTPSLMRFPRRASRRRLSREARRQALRKRR